MTVWRVRPVKLDGETFALRVYSLPGGFAAFADFGADVVTLHGLWLPPALELERRKLEVRHDQPDR